MVSDAAQLLLKAARRLEPFDLEFARETYLIAWRAAGMAGHLAGANVLMEICRAALALPPPPGAPPPLHLLLDGLALLGTDGRAAATPTLRQAAKALAGIPVEDVGRAGIGGFGDGGRDGNHMAAVPHGHRGDGPLRHPEEPVRLTRTTRA
jgi:hypothetical protein